jgi:3-methylcrotonyl-CoA carboxylase alpha subunit
LDFFRIGESHLVRTETGVALGSEISPFYDPMIAKLVSHRSTREGAIRNLANACRNSIVAPVKTNAAFLARALSHPDFMAANLDTGFIARNEEALIGSASPSNHIVECAAMAVLYDEMGDAEAVQLWQYEPRRPPQTFPGSVWRSLAGFRMNAPDRLRIALTRDGEMFVVEKPVEKAAMLSTIIKGDRILVSDMGQSFLFERARTGGGTAGNTADGAILSPMPGRVTAVDVAAGDAVTKGQRLVTLEAMKMEHSLTAPFDGTVEELNATAGAQVSEGAVLVKVVRASE